MSDYHSAAPPRQGGQSAGIAIRKFKGALAGGAAMSLGLSSPKNASNYDSMPVFSIDKNRRIPDKG